ncbi:hypothetical protein BDR06DRAFT_973799 [Suillus hirtellus]|nr:hypothetical protein BDR06DRAFT_973799 [Suillus hirtellus]
MAIMPFYLLLPSDSQDGIITAVPPHKVYVNAHAYHLHSILTRKPASPQMIYASTVRSSASVTRVSRSYLQSIDIMNIKPVNMEEVITAVEFHPQQYNLFMY